MVVFVVKGEYGSWDSFHTKILKIFDDKLKAEKFIEDYSNSVLIKKSKEIYHKIYSFDDSDDIIVLSEEDKKWRDENPDFWLVCEFNKCVIEEYNLE